MNAAWQPFRVCNYVQELFCAPTRLGHTSVFAHLVLSQLPIFFLMDL